MGIKTFIVMKIPILFMFLAPQYTFQYHVKSDPWTPFLHIFETANGGSLKLEETEAHLNFQSVSSSFPHIMLKDFALSGAAVA